MDKRVLTFSDIIAIVKPLAEKYNIREVYLFGSYAGNEADEQSDADVLTVGGNGFKFTNIPAFGYELRELKKDTDFYDAVMKERAGIA